MWSLLALLAACSKPVDVVDERPVVDDVPVDSEPDTDDAPPTDTPVETDGVDSDVLVESDAPPAPPAWVGGFFDLTAALPAGDQLAPHPGQAAPVIAPQEAWGVVADLDEDGAPEIIVGQPDWGSTPGAPAVRVWSLLGGVLRRATHIEAGLEARMGPALMALDLDGDGHADLLYGQTPTWIRWGRGDGTFEPAAPLDLGVPLASTFYGDNVADLDHDGWLDLLVGDQVCRATVVPMQRTGPRSFTARSDWLVESTPQGTTSSILVLPREDGSDVWAPMTWRCSAFDAHPGWYAVDVAGVEPVAVATDLGPSNAYWRLFPETFGGPFTGASPMGAAAIDLDGDRRLDVAMSLLLPQLELLTTLSDGSFDDRTGRASLVAANADPPGETHAAYWSIGAPDLDMDGRPELIVTQGDDANTSRLPRGLLTTPVVWWNGGDWRFTEVTADVGLAIAGNWHGLVLDDLDADGDADLILGGYGVPPRVLRNDLAQGRGLSLRLVGTTSNHLAIGALVDAEVAGLPDRRALVGETGNLAGTGAPWIWIGAGDSATVDRLTIHWPSGFVQELRAVPTGGARTIVEPETVTVLEPTRAAPADGTSTLVVVIRPRAPDGGPRRAAVEVALDGAPAALASLVEEADGRWTATIVAPAAPGSTRVTARIDGVEGGVRPRLWWR